MIVRNQLPFYLSSSLSWPNSQGRKCNYQAISQHFIGDVGLIAHELKLLGNFGRSLPEFSSFFFEQGIFHFALDPEIVAM